MRIDIVIVSVILAALVIAFVCEENLPSFSKKEIVTIVNAKIVGLSTGDMLTGDKTYLLDEHGHRRRINGIWGQVGETISIQCVNDGAFLRLKQ